MTGTTEQLVRWLAARTSRRSLLARIGALAAAAPLMPVLPVARAADIDKGTRSDFDKEAQSHDDKLCNYWRYCAIDGFLCSCCGGGVHTCPAGTQPSPTSWVGTCLNPDDGRSYLISYRDCCGAPDCWQCLCDNTERASPVYRPQGNNDIIWCYGLPSMSYSCSTAVLLGVAG